MVQWYTKSSFQRIDVEYIYTMDVPLCVCINIISYMILTKRTGKIGEEVEEGKGWANIYNP